MYAPVLSVFFARTIQHFWDMLHSPSRGAVCVTPPPHHSVNKWRFWRVCDCLLPGQSPCLLRYVENLRVDLHRGRGLLVLFDFRGPLGGAPSLLLDTNLHPLFAQLMNSKPWGHHPTSPLMYTTRTSHFQAYVRPGSIFDLIINVIFDCLLTAIGGRHFLLDFKKCTFKSWASC